MYQIGLRAALLCTLCLAASAIKDNGQSENTLAPPDGLEGKDLGIAVCVTGQLARLEIESKVKNLLEPLSRSHNVGLFLALELGRPVFVNGNSNYAQDSGCDKEPDEAEVYQGLFKPYIKATIFDPHTDYQMDETLWPHYRMDLPTPTARSTRLSNHRNQHLRTRQCVEMIRDAEVEAGGSYRSVIKIRDNSVVLKELDSLPTRDNAVVVKYCMSWAGGINDKVMVLPRARLEDGLGSVYDVLTQVQAGDPEAMKIANSPAVTNSETLLAAVLRDRHLPLEKVGSSDWCDELPVVDGRCLKTEGGGQMKVWCVVTRCKDCWPQGSWNMNITECPETNQPCTSTRLSNTPRLEAAMRREASMLTQALSNATRVAHGRVRRRSLTAVPSRQNWTEDSVLRAAAAFKQRRPSHQRKLFE